MAGSTMHTITPTELVSELQEQVAQLKRENQSNGLWKVLIETCNNIIENGNKKEWYYFKTFILTSNVCNIYVSCCIFFLCFFF